LKRKLGRYGIPYKKSASKRRSSGLSRTLETGKPMRWGRKNMRKVYVPPYRLSYCYDKKHDLLVLLAFYHKDEQ
jgi:mRNA-degrading endonuclease RelE of RelBE toxin-antitoxin system